MRCALHIFPQLADMDQIERIRAQYDPLYGLIPPHITLVFPLEAEKAELAQAMEQARPILQRMGPFALEMKQVVRQGDYLVLLIDLGKEKIACLHDDLYREAFAKWFSPQYEYVPHITLGRGAELPEDVQLSRKSCIADHAVLERICDDEKSEILEIIRFEGGK